MSFLKKKSYIVALCWKSKGKTNEHSSIAIQVDARSKREALRKARMRLDIGLLFINGYPDDWYYDVEKAGNGAMDRWNWWN